MTKKLDLLKNTDILSDLNKRELGVFSRLCQFINFKKGAKIFKKGSRSESFYIVDTGEVKIVNITEEKNENVLAFFIPGEIFGEFDLFEDDLHTATAIANRNSRLLSFPRQGENFNILYKKYPEIFVKICRKLIMLNAGRIRHTNLIVSEKTSWIEDLKKQMHQDKLTGFFNRAYLEDEIPSMVEEIQGKVSFLVVKPDEFKLINDNFGHEAGDIALKTIFSSTKSMLNENEIPVRYRGNEFIIIYLNTGLKETLKKAAELHHHLTNIDIGSIIAKKSLKLTYSMGISVYPDHAENIDNLVDLAFSKMFEQRDSGGDGILFQEENEKDIINFLRSVRIFTSLHLAELKIMSKYLKPLKMNEGDILCREGEDGDELFIVESGKAVASIKVQDKMEKEISEFSSGDFFGEMAIFENAKRSATCVAKEDGKIFKLFKKDFLTIMKKRPAIAITIMKEMLNITSSRLSKTGRFLSDMVRWGDDASKRAITDDLTGIYNRRYLESSLEESFDRAKEDKKSIALIMVDLDYFREVNEAYSHEVGDRYIIEVAKIFITCFRESDIVARYGGDEFTIILPETTLMEANKLAEDVRISVDNMNFLKDLSGPDIKLSASQGIAAYPENCDNLDTLKELADKALYKAKEAGRNRVICSDEC